MLRAQIKVVSARAHWAFCTRKRCESIDSTTTYRDHHTRARPHIQDSWESPPIVILSTIQALIRSMLLVNYSMREEVLWVSRTDSAVRSVYYECEWVAAQLFHIKRGAYRANKKKSLRKSKWWEQQRETLLFKRYLAREETIYLLWWARLRAERDVVTHHTFTTVWV